MKKLVFVLGLLTSLLIGCASTSVENQNGTVKIKPSKEPLLSIYINTNSGKDVASREEYEKATMKVGKNEYTLRIKGRGNSSWGQFPKHSYNLKLDEKLSFFDRPENKNWVLVSNYADKTLIRNLYCFYLGHEVFNRMLWNPTFKPVNLYLNGKYDGVYILGEKIDVAKVKIPVGKQGFLFEINRREDEYFNFRTKHDVSISLKEPDEPKKDEQARIRKIIQKAEDSMFAKNFADEKEGYAKYIDVDSFIDWYLINEFAKNVDSAWFSSIYVAYNPETEKLHFGPLWDYDLGFGNVNYNDCDKTEGFWIKEKSPWFKQLFKDENFRKKAKARWQEKRLELQKSIISQTNKLAGSVYNSTEQNFSRWPILGTYVWGNPNGFEDRTTYESEILYLQDWCTKRFNWLDKEIESW